MVDRLAASGCDGDVDPLDVVFDHLDRWRHFPNYQLERRADVFFSVYVKGVVEEFTGVALEGEIIPELPRRGARQVRQPRVYRPRARFPAAVVPGRARGRARHGRCTPPTPGSVPAMTARRPKIVAKTKAAAMARSKIGWSREQRINEVEAAIGQTAVIWFEARVAERHGRAPRGTEAGR
jgi:hypothetical protein